MFNSVSNTENGEVDGETTFYYRQKGKMSTKPDYNPVRQDRAKLFRYANGHAFSGKNMKEVFSTIFQERTWDEQGAKESVSGSGSSLGKCYQEYYFP